MLNIFNAIAIRWGADLAWRVLAVWLPLAALLLGAGAGAWGALHLGRAPLLVDIAELREGHTESLRLAQLAAAQRLQAAQTRSDTLALQLGKTLSANNTLSQEKTHALRAAATGRVCLSDGALRVLHGSPGIRVGGLDGVPPPGSAVAAAGAATATDSHPATPAGAPGLVATDADIGAWSIGAGALYEACRAHLDALIDWHATPSTGAAHDR